MRVRVECTLYIELPDTPGEAEEMLGRPVTPRELAEHELPLIVPVHEHGATCELAPRCFNAVPDSWDHS